MKSILRQVSGYSRLILLSAAIFTSSCSPKEKQEEKLVFQSGFEPDTRVIPFVDSILTMQLSGKDLSCDSLSNWDAAPFGHHLYGAPYDQGKEKAIITRDPLRQSNHVLQYILKQPTGYCGRMQFDIVNFSSASFNKEYFYSVRVFIPENMEALRDYPDAIGWLTLMEVFTGPQFTNNLCSRITFGMGKNISGHSDLYFIVTMENQIPYKNAYEGIWGSDSNLDWNRPKVPVPFGKWFTLEFYLKEGNKDTGRFYVAMTPDAGTKKVVFDVTNWTHNTNETNPNGFDGWNCLMKLYTAADLVTWMQNHGYLQIYWDDFKMWAGKQP